MQTGAPTDPVKLKVGIEDLYSLWRQRIDERRPLQYIMPPSWSTPGGGLDDDEDRGWADLGTGIRAIAIGIARALGTSGCLKVIATDLSSVAVQVGGPAALPRRRPHHFLKFI
ncbi:hypothetical protein CDL15_Pgr021148 [Punica granatum]|uniref:Uncharacterized protein n=1 Tax=Punica granatum TaxID=22663 RepID=A0A218WLD7_PUNGR|nr:hypothetical protein CDL15_Pgr021148 [Punica granatum]